VNDGFREVAAHYLPTIQGRAGSLTPNAFAGQKHC
jgi:hypothetical protein